MKADIFESDFSKATVITLFLLPKLNLKLRPTLLDLAPGTRIVSNSFTMDDWQPDETATVTEGCTSWCTALFWVVPAKVEGHLAARRQGSRADTEVPEDRRARSAARPFAMDRCAATRSPLTVGRREIHRASGREHDAGSVVSGGQWSATWSAATSVDTGTRSRLAPGNVRPVA